MGSPSRTSGVSALQSERLRLTRRELIAAGAAGWSERRGKLRYRGVGMRVSFDPETGKFSASRSGIILPLYRRNMNSVEIRSGSHGGSSTDFWGEAAGPGIRLFPSGPRPSR